MEYIILSAVIMVCAVVSLLSVWADIGRMAEKAQICVNCDETQRSRDYLDENGQPRFDAIDRNSDGAITSSEASIAGAPDIMAADRNNDGRISEEELLTYRPEGEPDADEENPDNDGNETRLPTGTEDDPDPDGNDPGTDDPTLAENPTGDEDTTVASSGWSWASMFTGAPAVYDWVYDIWNNMFGYGNETRAA